jgi:uncharacterized protein YecE (DUF72 family)
MNGKIEVGCGSWSDAEYTGVLYPKGLPAEQRLACYATWFQSVEVNSSYYATPRLETVKEWVKRTPPGFTFHIKLHRAFSQSPAKVAADGRLLKALLSGVQPLIKAKKLGSFLLMLAPNFTPEKHTLEEIDTLVKKLRPHPLAVELRYSAWVDEKNRAQTVAYFRKRKITWVSVDMPQLKHATLMPPMDEVTNSGLAYLRLHGRNKNYLKAKSAEERHHFKYSGRELKEVAARIQVLAKKAERVFVVANNHAEDFAPRTALALKLMLGNGSKTARKPTKRQLPELAGSLT